ncbi:hypothetical protein M3Y97_00215600 [Aphelenchoides bicaudatus]|nr:hypothetical protein M3Y97_00215600 [Aphelenchoides bicaudatus]
MDGEKPSSSNWSVARKSISLPDFCVNSGKCFNAEGGQDAEGSYIKIKSDYLNNETHILIRSNSPTIVITPPPIDQTFRYSPYLKSMPYPKMKLRSNRKNISVPEISTSYGRMPSRLFKRRNAMSAADLTYLQNSGRSLLLLPNESSNSLELKCRNPAALKLKKRVTFTNSTPILRQHGEFDSHDVYSNLDKITADCIQMFGKLCSPNDSSSSLMDTSALVNDFRNACQISLTNGHPVSTEKLSTRFSAVPLNETITTVTAPTSTTSASFIACNKAFNNMSCLNL